MAIKPDTNGRFHDDEGRFVNIKEFVNRIFDERQHSQERLDIERETSTEFKRVALENALAEAKLTTKQQLTDAKAAVDGRIATLQERLDMLEKGGAPFASRLDKSLLDLTEDVDILTKDAVRTKVLDALREQDEQARSQQARQIRLSLIGAALSLGIALVNLLVGG